MLKKMREDKLMRKIYKVQKENLGLFEKMFLNNIRSEAAEMLIMGKISFEFYENVFSGNTLNLHWSEKIKNLLKIISNKK